MTTNTMPQHLHESELLHLIDRDAAPAELELWSGHLRGCADCAAELARLRRRAERLSVRLAELDLPADFRHPSLPSDDRQRSARPHPAPGRGGWLRAAAVVLLLLSPLLLVEPVRAWVAERLAGLRAPDETPAVPAPDGAAGAVEESGSTLWFTPTGAELRVEIVSTQRTGTLVLRPAEGEQGALQVLGGTGEMPILTGAGVTIRNAPQSTASYEIAVPRQIGRVLVRVGDGTTRVLDADAVARGVEIGLGGRD